MKIGFLSAVLLASNMAAAAPPIDGWYTSLFGGYTYLPSNVNALYQNIFYNKTNYDSGYHAGGRVGYQDNPMRYEGELTYINGRIHQFYANNTKQIHIGGQSSAIAAMANIYYDVPEILPCIIPFLGGGIGYSGVNAHFFSNDRTGATFFRGANTVFTYQATAGLTYNFVENYALNIAYRYLSTINSDQLGARFQANLASVGIVFRFDEGSYN